MKNFSTLAILAVIVVISIITYRFLKPRKSAGGFGDWVKNPDYRQAADEYFAARDAFKI